MSQVIIYQNEFGAVAICNPASGFSIDTVLKKDVPQNRNAQIVERSSLPMADLDFFNAWKLNGTKIEYNMQIAKSVTKTRLRFEREPLLAKLDIEFQRATEQQSSTVAIVQAKQRLRDITNEPDPCTTLAELRLIKC